MIQSERFFSFEEAKSKIEFWCAYRDRSTYETQAKLISYGQNEKDISLLIDHLKEYDFLDEERFVNGYVSGKFRLKKWGRKKIYANLLPKKVEKSLVQSALQSLDDEAYMLTIDELIDKKNNLLRNEKDPWKKKQKVLQYLISRGFEYDIVQSVISKKQL